VRTAPYAVGGRRLASLATQPLIVDFLDIVTHGEKGIEFRLEEFSVPKESPLANQTIAQLQIGDKTGAMVLAIRTYEGRFDTTPSAQDTIRPNDTLIVLGTREQVTRLEALMRGEELVDEGL
jgi:voltage-gated potassium channel